MSTSSEGGDEQWLVPRLRLARIAALPNRAHGETWRRIADVERVVEILHVTSSIRESSSGLAEVLVFSSELPQPGRQPSRR